MPRRIRFKVLTCKRCEYMWVPRVNRPILCPNCRSPYWNRARKKKTK